MEYLERKITVFEPSYVKPLYVVQNSNMREIRIIITDWDIPSGAEVKWQVATETKGELNSADVDGNTIYIRPYTTTFSEAGQGYLQVRVDYDGRTLISFAIDVYIQEDRVTNPVEGSNSDVIKLLVEQYVDDATGTLFEDLEAQAKSELASIRATGDAVIESIPSDYSTLEQATYNAYPTQSETGNPIYIDDAAEDIPIKELIVNLEPIQSGSGDPSPTNVRPISGYDGVVVKRTGKNILKLPTYEDWHALSAENGYRRVPIKCVPNTQYYLNTSYLNGYTSVGKNMYILISPNLINDGWKAVAHSSTGASNGTITTNNSGYLYLAISTSTSEANWNELVANCQTQLELGSTATEYEPYTEQEYSITFPSSVGTLYGGKLNVTTGLLTIDRYNLWLDPTMIPDKYIHFDVLTNNARVGNLILTSHFGLTSAYNAKYSSEGAFRNGALSNWSVERNKGYSSDTSGFYFSGTDRFYLFCPKSIFATQDASGFKQYLTDNPLYICYELETPITYQLTPTEVSTLLGNNTIQSDGSMELTYRADTTKVIEKLTNAIISMGGNV